MKSCPTCNRTYADDTLTFCLADGALLSAAYDPQATQILPPARPTTIASSTPPNWPPGYSPAPYQESKDHRLFYVLGAAFLFLIMGLGVTVWLVLRSNTEQRSGSITNPSSTGTPTLSPEAGKTARANSSPDSTTPARQQPPDVAPAPRSDPFAGTWTEYWPGIPQNATHVVTKRGNEYEIQGSSPLTERYLISNVRLDGDILKFSEGTATFTVEYELRSKNSDVLSVRAKGRSGWRDDIVWKRVQ